MDYQKLFEEISKPEYQGMTDVEIAASLNTAGQARNLTAISGDVAFQQTDATEFAGLTDAKKQLWLAFCGRNQIDPWAAANVAFVQWIFGNQSLTVANLAAARAETVSRAEQLGLGTVSVGLIIEARQWGADNA